MITEEQGILLGYLENLLGPSTEKSGPNYAFHCPSCHHRKKKLEVNLKSHKYGCWVCGFRGKSIPSLLYKIHAPIDIRNEIVSMLPEKQKDISEYSTGVTLPREFKTLPYSPKNYTHKRLHGILNKRGLTSQDILKYNIGYCDSGDYSGRFIIPSYDIYNQLNYFTSRTYENAFNKYKNPEADRDKVVFFENLINWNMPVIIVEGVFDAIGVKRNSLPLLGKKLTDGVRQRIIISKNTDYYIALDPDAFDNALDIAQEILSMGKRVFLIELQDNDPSELGFREFTKILREAEELTFPKILSYKMRF